MAEAVNPQTTALAGEKNATPEKGYAEGSPTSGNIPEQLGYGVPKNAGVITPNVPQSLGYGVPQQTLQNNPGGYAQTADQQAKYLASQGDIAGAMEAAQRRNTYMQENNMAYNPKPTALTEGQTNTPGNLGYTAPTYQGVPQNATQAATAPVGSNATTSTTGNAASTASGATTAENQANAAVTDPNASPTGPITADYVSNMSTKLDEFLNKSISAYQKISDDFQKYMDGATAETQKGMQAIIDNLQRKEELYQQEKQDGIAREEARRDRMLTVAEQKKDNSLKMNELAAAETDAQWEQRQKLAEDNNARYLGYLNAKMSANGFVKGSAGLLSIGKYMAASELALNDITRSRANAAATYAAKGKEILDSYFDNAYQIEYDASTKISEINFKMNDAILDISTQKTQTEMQKNMQILEIAKEANAQKLQIQSNSDNLVMQVTQQKMADMQLAHQITMDYMNQERAQDTFDWQVKTDQRNYDRGVVESDRAYEFQDRQQDFTEKYTEKQFNEDVRQFGLSYALQKAQQAEQVRQFDKTMEYNKDKDAIAQKLEDRAYRAQMVKDGLMSPKTLDQYLSPDDIILSQDYVGKDGSIENMGDRVARVFEAAGTGVKNLANGYQCVQFVRDLLPDLPTGLFTLADKVREMTKGKGSIKAPEPGAAVVLNWGAGSDANNKPGHVAFVTNVSPDGKTFDIVQFNAPKAGEKSTQTIRTDDPTIMGYWKSPNVKPTQGTAKNSKIIEGLGSGLQSMVDAVTRNAKSNDQAAGDLQSLREYAAKGDTEGFNKYLRNAAIANLTTEDKNKYGTWSDMVRDSDRFLTALPNFDTASGPYKRLFESTKPWLGIEKDSEFQSIAGLAGLTTQAYRLMNAGQNLSPAEQENLSAFLPTKDDTFKELYTKMEGLRRFADVNAEGIVDRSMGLDPTLTTSRYDSVQVKAKDTGETAYVDRDTYEKYKDQFDLLQ